TNHWNRSLTVALDLTLRVFKFGRIIFNINYLHNAELIDMPFTIVYSELDEFLHKTDTIKKGVTALQ
ncbi:hypothetical protein, partial [Lentilactobacillus hilgardii]|uniref:hypothetical protein n=1 Tax=Lentilactobacillus hilgardii TaxID=1588 RepID=UPI0039EBAB19